MAEPPVDAGAFHDSFTDLLAGFAFGERTAPGRTIREHRKPILSVRPERGTGALTPVRPASSSAPIEATFPCPVSHGS